MNRVHHLNCGTMLPLGRRLPAVMPRDLDALPSDDPHLVLEAVRGEAKRVRAEGVRLDQLGARAQIVAMDAFHQRGAREVQLVEAVLEADTTLVEEGAHRAVGEQWALGETREQEGRHALAL